MYVENDDLSPFSNALTYLKEKSQKKRMCKNNGIYEFSNKDCEF